VKFTMSPPAPAIRKMAAAGAQHRKDLRTAAVIATDRASKDGQRAVQAKIRSVGLGKLANAVGHTSLKREGKGAGNQDPYGVIYARGGDESSGGGALEAYSRGTVISPKSPGGWLWIPTRAIPRFISAAGRRFRTTPQLYNNSGLVTSIGKLQFKPIGNGKALLVIRKASVSIKTGRAKAPISRKSKLSTVGKDVVAFVGIKITQRAQRFDQRHEMSLFARALPRYLKAALDEINARRS
jgi:hypothetical protein